MDEVLRSVVEKIDPPMVDDSKDDEKKKLNPLKAFLFDARYVPNRGVACLIKIMGGGFLDFQKIKQLTSYHTGKRYDVYDVGIVKPMLSKTDVLPEG